MSPWVKTLRHRIATLAEHVGGRPLKSIHHLLDRFLLGEAHASLAGNKASGIDGETKGEFGLELSSRIDELIDQACSQTYRAPAVRRVEIPKGDGKTRPIGIPTDSDKVLQKGFVMLVEPVFEREFHPGSYGYRPHRSAHDAVKATHQALHSGHYWVVELDIKGFFDSIPHCELQEMFRRRISDGVLNRLVLGWLKAGVMKEDRWTASEEGTPQGGIVSPLLFHFAFKLG
jgi:RNA-directed DNA polymerase